jgi:hypothetical protein
MISPAAASAVRVPDQSFAIRALFEVGAGEHVAAADHRTNSESASTRALYGATKHRVLIPGGPPAHVKNAVCLFPQLIPQSPGFG